MPRPLPFRPEPAPPPPGLQPGDGQAPHDQARDAQFDRLRQVEHDTEEPRSHGAELADQMTDTTRALIRHTITSVPFLQGAWPSRVLSIEDRTRRRCTVQLLETGGVINNVQADPTNPTIGGQYAARRTVRLNPAATRGAPEEVHWTLKVMGQRVLYWTVLNGTVLEVYQLPWPLEAGATVPDTPLHTWTGAASVFFTARRHLVGYSAAQNALWLTQGTNIRQLFLSNNADAAGTLVGRQVADAGAGTATAVATAGGVGFWAIETGPEAAWFGGQQYISNTTNYYTSGDASSWGLIYSTQAFGQIHLIGSHISDDSWPLATAVYRQQGWTVQAAEAGPNAAEGERVLAVVEACTPDAPFADGSEVDFDLWAATARPGSHARLRLLNITASTQVSWILPLPDGARTLSQMPTLVAPASSGGGATVWASFATTGTWDTVLETAVADSVLYAGAVAADGSCVWTAQPAQQVLAGSRDGQAILAGTRSGGGWTLQQTDDGGQHWTAGPSAIGGTLWESAIADLA